MSKFVSVAKASEILGVTKWTIRKWVKDGILTRHTFNGYNLAIDSEEIEKLTRAFGA